MMESPGRTESLSNGLVALSDKLRYQSESDGFITLLYIAARLRGDDGCPWDREQTHESLKPCVLEESYEVIDAIDTGCPVKLREELGDLLMLVVMHAQIAAEAGRFNIGDALHSINAKLMRRHPHVFGDGVANTPDEVLARWESIKNEDTGCATIADKIDHIPAALPALSRAAKVQKTAATVGFDWESPTDAVHKVVEEVREVSEALGQSSSEKLSEELGDLLFAVVNVARLSRIDAEDALRQATRKFARRFAEVEQRATAEGSLLSCMGLSEMDKLWESVKEKESDSVPDQPWQVDGSPRG